MSIDTEEREYHGIRFPDRAESIERFNGYRVFLDYWKPLAEKLQRFYEGAALRGATRTLAVWAPQGGGKTLFARKLAGDYKNCSDTISSLKPLVADPQNLWQMVTCGGATPKESNIAHIKDATLRTDIVHIEDDPKWVETVKAARAKNTNRRMLVIVDNAERSYFRQGLVNISDEEFSRNHNSNALNKLAAERFVALGRTALQGAVFVVLTNDAEFVMAFGAEVERQHNGMLEFEPLPLPDTTTKETIVRVNTNRLNPVSYWYCLDKAGPNEKQIVFKKLKSASTFPESFEAVSVAIRTANPSRIGRPGRKCVITLVVLLDTEDVTSVKLNDTFGSATRDEFSTPEWSLALFGDRWASKCVADEREARLLESEWQLRVALLGNKFVSALLNSKHPATVKSVLDILCRFHGPGTFESTRANTRSDAVGLAGTLPTTDASVRQFWSAGASRSVQYETALKSYWPNYNVSGPGFMQYRPDYTVAPYVPCSIVTAKTDGQDDINGAIRREAHVLEFTATNTADVAANIVAYLGKKLSNYISITQEQ